MKRRTATGTEDVLELCKAVKLARAQLYHHFADLFKQDRESLLLWLKKAMDEENHSRLFALVGKLRNDGVIDSIRIDLAETEKARKQVRSLLNRVKKSPPSHQEALRIALEMEKSSQMGMAEDAIAFADESFSKLFLPICRTDAGGLEALQEAYRRATV